MEQIKFIIYFKIIYKCLWIIYEFNLCRFIRINKNPYK